jgi:hypothetical protein
MNVRVFSEKTAALNFLKSLPPFCEYSLEQGMHGDWYVEYPEDVRLLSYRVQAELGRREK